MQSLCDYVSIFYCVCVCGFGCSLEANILFAFKMTLCTFDNAFDLSPSPPAERGPAQAAAARPRKMEAKSRRMLRRQPDSLDSVDSASTASSSVSSTYLHPPSSASSSRTRRFRFRSKSPSSSATLGRSNNGNDSGGSVEVPEQDPHEERAQFTSRGTFNPEKGRQKLHGAKALHHSATEASGHHKREPDLQSQQQQQQQQQHLVLYGSNEFMV